jgi:hypothetical protein
MSRYIKNGGGEIVDETTYGSHEDLVPLAKIQALVVKIGPPCLHASDHRDGMLYTERLRNQEVIPRTRVHTWRILNENMLRLDFSKLDLMKSWRQVKKDQAVKSLPRLPRNRRAKATAMAIRGPWDWNGSIQSEVDMEFVSVISVCLSDL